jgi:hypothetical protein
MVKIFLPSLISLSLLGCASTTPNFDQNFGKSLRDAVDKQKIKNNSDERQAGALPWAKEFSSQPGDTSSGFNSVTSVGGGVDWGAALERKYNLMERGAQFPASPAPSTQSRTPPGTIIQTIPLQGGPPQPGIVIN